MNIILENNTKLNIIDFNEIKNNLNDIKELYINYNDKITEIPKDLINLKYLYLKKCNNIKKYQIL